MPPQPDPEQPAQPAVPPSISSTPPTPLAPAPPNPTPSLGRGPTQPIPSTAPQPTSPPPAQAPSFQPVTPPAVPATAAPNPASTPPPPVAAPVAPLLTDQPSGVVVGGVPADSLPPPPKRRKWWMLALPIVAVVLLLASVGVFAFYLPSRPENVWSSGLDNTGKALDQFVTQATDKSKLDLFSKVAADGSIDATTAGSSFSGTFSSKYDPRHSTGELSVTAKSPNGPQQTLGTKFITDLPAGSTYPNIYFQLIGIKALGLDTFLPGISDYDSKWIAVDSSYLQTLVPVKTVPKQKEDFTAADSAELAKAVSAQLKTYIFTGDSNKSIIVRKSFVAKETSEGQGTYHYTAAINKDNYKKACQGAITAVMSTNAYKKLPGVDAANLDKSQASTIKSCQDDADKANDSDTFDVWINSRTKLIQKFRLPDDQNQGTYVDIGQLYKSGDEVPFFVTYHNDKSHEDGTFNLTLNSKTNVASGTLDVNSGSGTSQSTVKVKFTVKPYNGEINVDRPAGAVPLQDVLKKLGLDPSMLGGL